MSPTECLFTVDQFQQLNPSASNDSRKPARNNVYVIRPYSIWESMARFAKLERQHWQRLENSHGDEVYKLQDTIIAYDPNHSTPRKRIARILEIRAFDENNAFIRVFYMHSIADIPQLMSLGYESDREDASEEEVRREIVATNEMGIIKASAVNRKLEATYVDWTKGGQVPPKGYWWRWKWDIGNLEAS
ncbi:MAG: hypothetical protein Q9217_005240 [Psora testacea]